MKPDEQSNRMLPRRPRAHVIADQALFQLQSLLASFGWTADRVQSDYGEDLAVELAHAGVVEGFRFLVQVKATDDLGQHERAEHYASAAIKLSTINKWVQSTEPVMLVLWDVTESIGVYDFAQNYFSKVVMEEIRHQESHEVRIPKESWLTRESARRIRAQYLYLRACDAALRALGLAFLATDADDPDHEVRLATVDSVTPFLEAIDILSNTGEAYGLRWEFEREVYASWMLYLQKDPTDDVLQKEYLRTSLRRGVIIALVSYVQKATGWGARMSQLQNATSVLMVWFADLLRGLMQALAQEGTRSSDDLIRWMIEGRPDLFAADEV